MLQIRTPNSNRNGLQSELGTARFRHGGEVSFQPGSRTPVTKSSTYWNYRFFPAPSAKYGNALALQRNHVWRRSLCRVYILGFLTLSCSFSLFADTPAMLRTVPAAGCYCHCAESHVRGGCAKLCDSKRYASRWRATRCAKPHMHTPANDSHAGPRFPRPGRAEHAKL